MAAFTSDNPVVIRALVETLRANVDTELVRLRATAYELRERPQLPWHAWIVAED